MYAVEDTVGDLADRVMRFATAVASCAEDLTEEFRALNRSSPPQWMREPTTAEWARRDNELDEMTAEVRAALAVIYARRVKAA